MRKITDTYDAAALTIAQQGLDGEISTNEAEQRMARTHMIAQCVRYGVPIVVLSSRSLDKWARRLGLKL